MKINTQLAIPICISVLVLSGLFIYNKTKKPQQYKEMKTIVVGLDDAFPPIGFRTVTGDLTGFDVELAREAIRRMGYTAVFKPVIWDSVILSLNKKDIDVIWNGMTITDKRKKEIIFSDPYLKGENVFIVKDFGITSKKDLVGKTIGLQSGSEQEETISKDSFKGSFKEVRTYDTIQAALLDMKTGRVDAVFADNFAGLYTAAQVLKNDPKVKAISGDYGTTVSGVGIRKTDIELQNKLNKVLIQMRADKSINALAKKWFGSDELLVK